VKEPLDLQNVRDMSLRLLLRAPMRTYGAFIESGSFRGHAVRAMETTLENRAFHYSGERYPAIHLRRSRPDAGCLLPDSRHVLFTACVPAVMVNELS